MKLADLQKKIAEVLGVSGSQKELSFEIFLSKISEILLEQITLKVPRVGFFQLKNVPGKNGICPLIFSPLSENISPDTKNLYLTIDVTPKKRSAPEFDSSIFSIGVGKPLLPLSSDEMPDAETSYAMLRKSIEERVKELLMESDQIPNFNIWDDYYRSNDDFDDEQVDDARSQLSKLTADIDFKKEIIPDKIPENILEILNPLPNSNDPKIHHDGRTSNFSELEIQEGTGSKESTSFKESAFEKQIENNRASDENAVSNSEGLISENEDYFALENFEFGEEAKEQLTISELMEDDYPLMEETPTANNEETELEEYGIPTKETLEKILADEDDSERKNAVENSTNDITDQKDSDDDNSKKKSEPEPDTLESSKLSSENSPGEDVREDDKNISEIYKNEVEPSESPSFEELHKLTNETVHIAENEEVSVEEHNVLNWVSAIPDESGQKPIDRPDEPDNNAPVPDVNTDISSDEPGKFDDESIRKEESEKKSIDEPDKFVNEVAPPDENEKDSFEELNKLSSEVNLSEENEEDSFEEASTEEEEKIEWNWGDELREEFGIPSEEGEDVKFEMINKQAKDSTGELELVDDYLDEENTAKDLFAKLEKTIEREFKFDEDPVPRLTVDDKKSTLGKNKLKKVVLEFSGPPAKYEFVEERPSEKERRMAISLVDEGGAKVHQKRFETDEEIIESSKDSYFGKMFMIIFGAFIIVSAVVVFIILNGNKTDKTKNTAKPADQIETNLASDSANVNSDTQSQLSNNSSVFDNDDMSDFPRTATPPVPIKDATDKQILETIKKESAKLQTSKKVNTPVTANQANVKAENQGLYKTPAVDTKISNRVFYDGKNFSLQISSWPNRARAEEEVNRLRDLGFSAFIVQANLPQKGGIWYRVRVGPFRTEKEADEFLRNNNF